MFTKRPLKISLRSFLTFATGPLNLLIIPNDVCLISNVSNCNLKVLRFEFKLGAFFILPFAHFKTIQSVTTATATTSPTTTTTTNVTKAYSVYGSHFNQIGRILLKLHRKFLMLIVIYFDNYFIYCAKFYADIYSCLSL